MGPKTVKTHTSLVTVVTSTDRPMPVRNRCVIELFGRVFVFSFVSMHPSSFGTYYAMVMSVRVSGSPFVRQS